MFTEDKRPAVRKGYPIGCTPEQLIWDGDKIYIAAKRDKSGSIFGGGIVNALPMQGKLLGVEGRSDGGAYTILNANNGDILAVLGVPQGTPAMMSVLNDKLLVVTDQGTRAHFLQ